MNDNIKSRPTLLLVQSHLKGIGKCYWAMPSKQNQTNENNKKRYKRPAHKGGTQTSQYRLCTAKIEFLKPYNKQILMICLPFKTNFLKMKKVLNIF